MEVRIRLKLLGRAAVLTWTGRLKSIRLLRLLQTPVLDAHLDGRSLLQAVEKDGRPLSSLWRISQILRDPSSCRSETSSQERSAFGGRSPPQSERARAVGKSTRAEIPTPGLLGGKDLLCMVCRPLFLLTPARGAPRPCTGQPSFVLAVLCGRRPHKRRPQGAI